MLPFRNNLEANDRVFDTISKRQGKVFRKPKSEKNRYVSILYDGTTCARYIDVMQLRLMPDGRHPEEQPPVDGIPPAIEESEENAAPPAELPDPVALLKAAIEANTARLRELETEFRRRKAENEKLEKALAVLKSDE